MGGTLFLSADDGGEEGAEGEPAHSASMRHSMVRATRRVLKAGLSA